MRVWFGIQNGKPVFSAGSIVNLSPLIKLLGEPLSTDSARWNGNAYDVTYDIRLLNQFCVYVKSQRSLSISFPTLHRVFSITAITLWRVPSKDNDNPTSSTLQVSGENLVGLMDILFSEDGAYYCKFASAHVTLQPRAGGEPVTFMYMPPSWLQRLLKNMHELEALDEELSA